MNARRATRPMRSEEGRAPVSRAQFTGLRRRIAAVLTGLLTLGLLVAVASPAQAVVNNPPSGSISLIVFPQRDFVSASGYTQDDRVAVRVIHSAELGGGRSAPARPRRSG